jgi:hypothetical protein
MGEPHEAEQTSVAGDEVEHATRVGGGELFDERDLSFGAMWYRVGPREVGERVLHQGPLAQRVLYAFRYLVVTLWVPSGRLCNR